MGSGRAPGWVLQSAAPQADLANTSTRLPLFSPTSWLTGLITAPPQPGRDPGSQLRPAVITQGSGMAVGRKALSARPVLLTCPASCSRRNHGLSHHRGAIRYHVQSRTCDRVPTGDILRRAHLAPPCRLLPVPVWGQFLGDHVPYMEGLSPELSRAGIRWPTLLDSLCEGVWGSGGGSTRGV